MAAQTGAVARARGFQASRSGPYSRPRRRPDRRRRRRGLRSRSALAWSTLAEVGRAAAIVGVERSGDRGSRGAAKTESASGRSSAREGLKPVLPTLRVIPAPGQGHGPREVAPAKPPPVGCRPGRSSVEGGVGPASWLGRVAASEAEAGGNGRVCPRGRGAGSPRRSGLPCLFCGRRARKRELEALGLAVVNVLEAPGRGKRGRSIPGRTSLWPGWRTRGPRRRA